MGTFHSDKGDLHGITVVVDTPGPTVYVGRCDEANAQHVILLDIDTHEDGANGQSKEQFVRQVAKFGHWKKQDRLVLNASDVTSIKRLAEYAKPAAPKVNADTVGAGAVAVAATVASGGSAAKSLATAVVEPPKKADTSPKLVELTENAQTEVLRLIKEDGRPQLGLRLGVKGGGCSGLSYKIEFDTRKDGDVAIEYPNFNIFLDKKSTIYLRGINLDHQKGLQGKGFVFHNPNATNTCGCGESFSV